jgi:hypothetical protein
MSDDKPDTIIIIDAVELPAVPPGRRPLHPRGLGDTALQVTERTVDEVRANMTRFLSGVQKILAEGAAIGGAFEIDTVEINAQVTGEGKIGFAGTGVNLKGDTGVKIIFKRQKKDNAKLGD